MGNSLPHLFKNKDVESRLVTTKYGIVVGKRLISTGDKQVDAFLGIPYAKPPIGERRFKKPEPPDPWEGVRRTEKFARRGIQKEVILFLKWQATDTSEDCLYLNVFTPVWSPPPEGFPVMVFVHGGGFVSDSSVKYGDVGICRHMVKHGVVVITIQYRLGYLGFFSTGDSACTDNLALWDMTAALTWVQDNIGAFGGNKNNVTVFGQSAGGASVDLLSLSPYSRDLFHKVIPMAGNACCDWVIHQNAVEKCRAFAASLGVVTENSTELMKKLRGLDASKFAIAMEFEPNRIETIIGPRIDNDFLPKEVSLLRKEAPAKPALVGTCQYEGLLFSTFNFAKKISIGTLEDFIALFIPEKHYEDFKSLRKKALRLYIDPAKDSHNERKLQLAFVNLYSDFFLNIYTQEYVLQRILSPTQKTFFYSFDYSNPDSWGIMNFIMPFKGATHCTELAYLFNVGIILPFSFTEDDNKMVALMTELWTNFAKYGDPNGSGETHGNLNFVWDPVERSNPYRYLSISLKSEMKNGYSENRPQFWIDVRKRLKKNG